MYSSLYDKILQCKLNEETLKLLVNKMVSKKQ